MMYLQRRALDTIHQSFISCNISCTITTVCAMLFLAHSIIHRASTTVPHHPIDVLLGRCLAASLTSDWARTLHVTPTPQANSGSPPREKLRALPFVVSLQQAQAAYAHFHRSSWLSQITPTAEHIKEVYMPWWMVAADVHVSVDSAQVGTRADTRSRFLHTATTGNDQLVRHYNPASRRYETRWETVWQWVYPNWRYQRRYTPEDPIMQIYGSHKYNRNDIQRLAPGPLLRTLARPLTADMAVASTRSITRKVTAHSCYCLCIRTLSSDPSVYDATDGGSRHGHGCPAVCRGTKHRRRPHQGVWRQVCTLYQRRYQVVYL